jgi:hypothetical protein
LRNKDSKPNFGMLGMYRIRRGRFGNAEKTRRGTERGFLKR